MASERKIDDRDSSISYSRPLLGSEWSELGSSQEYMNTTSLTRIKGASAKISFSGASIAVYGTISSTHVDSGTTSQYRIDGGAVGEEYTTSPTVEAQYGVKFFQSSSLSPGQHTLEVLNESQDGWLLLDYFVIATGSNRITPSNTSASTSSILSTTSTHSTKSSITSTTSSGYSSSALFAPTGIVDDASDTIPKSTPASLTDINTSRRADPPAGVLVGTICGGTFGMILLVALIWLIRRKIADRDASTAAAIPMDAPMLSPSPKVIKGFTSAHAIDTPGAMIQVHQHNQYGSNASNPNAYPFSPVEHQRGAPPPDMAMLEHYGQFPNASPQGVGLGRDPCLEGAGTSEQVGYGHGGQVGGSSHLESYGIKASLPDMYPDLPPGLSDPFRRSLS